MQDIERAPIKGIAAAIGRIPSGCAILTAKTASRRTGMLASWIQQAAFEPPMISVAVRKGRFIESLIDESGAFVVNLLGDSPAAMFKHFGKGFGPDDDAFAGLPVTDHAAGVIIPGRIAWLACGVRARHDAGDHWLYLGEIIEAEAQEAAMPYVHLRKNGLSY
jgi:flavin reductase (DIM6/NTAB) family NADH-FMN oxidoreductase RutF